MNLKDQFMGINMKYGSSKIESFTNDYKNNQKNIILCGTHNNRLECYFKNINNNFPNKFFNNCVIIKCYRINNKVKFSMIYEGEDIYNLNNNWDILSFNQYINNFSYDIDLPNNTEIFLIRHALGVHNKMNLLEKVFNLKIDSQLDNIGFEQAERAGIFLRGYLKNFYDNNKLFFMASHLVRTQQTIGIIMKMLELINSINQRLFIVPCSHELNNSSNNCDASILEYIPIASNIPRCKNNNNDCNLLTNFPKKYNNYKVDINWDYYMNFYKSNKKCQNTNMIAEIINLYLNLI